MDSYKRFVKKRNRKIQNSVVGVMIFSVVYIGFPTGSFLLGLSNLQTSLEPVLIVSTLLSLLIACFFGWMFGTFFRTVHHFRVVAYYNCRVDDPLLDTWLTGKAIFHNLKDLDDLCDQAGIQRMTEFGFLDDLDGDKMIWHNPLDGLVTIRTLINQLYTEESDTTPLLSELEKIEYALTQAASKDIQFAFILRPVNGGTSGQEMEIRQGTFW
ncbi:MAG TPA: hypothetical protein PLL06_20690 [Acidobacteriota bacterium]|nr:hypothetical protein [Acidobacteriota bacterium]